MADFKLAGIVSAVGLGLGYLLGGRSSKVMEAVQGEYEIAYLESHNDAKNQHKYYLTLTDGDNYYSAYGRLPGYGREVTMKLDKQPSQYKLAELIGKKMKTYDLLLLGKDYDQIPSEIRAKLDAQIGVKPSSPPAKSKPQKEGPMKPVNPRLAMAMKRRQMMGAEGTLYTAGKWRRPVKFRHLDNKKYDGAIELQGYGFSPAKLGENLQIGDVLVWNNGYKSRILDIQPKGKQSLVLKTMTQDTRYKKGEEFERTIRKNRLVGVAQDFHKFNDVMIGDLPPVAGQPKPVNPRLAMAMKRKQMMKADQALLLDEEDDGELMAAEYQPDQELGDYSVSEIAKSSAIEGYQPNKYSFGPISLGAESISDLKLKKDSCCCGATKKTPCICMVLGSDCSAKKPMCACYRLKAIQEGDKKAAESNDKTNLTLKEMGLLRGIENDYKGNQWEDLEGRMSASLYHDEWDMRVYRGVMSSLAKKGIIEIGEPEKGGRNIMANWVIVNPKYTVGKGDDLEINWNLFDYKEMNERFPNVSLEQTLRLIDGVPHVFNPSQEAKKAESNDSDSMPVIDPKHKTDAFKWIKEEGKHIKSDADKQMDEYDYTAMTFLPEELESGAVNALNAGDLEAAQTFVKALNRQNFIKEFQAERYR